MELSTADSDRLLGETNSLLYLTTTERDGREAARTRRRERPRIRSGASLFVHLGPSPERARTQGVRGGPMARSGVAVGVAVAVAA